MGIIDLHSDQNDEGCRKIVAVILLTGFTWNLMTKPATINENQFKESIIDISGNFLSATHESNLRPEQMAFGPPSILNQIWHSCFAKEGAVNLSVSLVTRSQFYQHFYFVTVLFAFKAYLALSINVSIHCNLFENLSADNNNLHALRSKQRIVNVVRSSLRGNQR